MKDIITKHSEAISKESVASFILAKDDEGCLVAVTGNKGRISAMMSAAMKEDENLQAMIEMVGLTSILDVDIDDEDTPLDKENLRDKVKLIEESKKNFKKGNASLKKKIKTAEELLKDIDKLLNS